MKVICDYLSLLIQVTRIDKLYLLFIIFINCDNLITKNIIDQNKNI